MYINREISWLEFNQRVLNQGRREDLPLLERVKFLSISASNLDEFFQVRVGGLVLRRQGGKSSPDLAGFSPTEQLQMIHSRVRAMVGEQYALLEQLRPELEAHQLYPQPMSSLDEVQYAALLNYFNAHIAPLLTPMAMEVERPPLLPNLSLILALELQSPEQPEPRLLAVTLPDSLPRCIHAAALGRDAYVLLEDLTAAFIGTLFPQEQLLHVAPFRVTRNGDIAAAEEEGGDFAHEMEEVLVARRFSDCVRLEIPADTDEAFAARMVRMVGAEEEAAIYRVPGMLRLVDLGSLAFEPGHEHLKVQSWTPVWPSAVDTALSMFENIAQGDILIHNPFESYEPVVRLLEEAAADPDVIAIKQVLYRTAHHSRFISALCRAAESGKLVTVLVELKARFDERHNLAQAERLQRAGVQVIYGVKGFKTHAKIMLIVRRENGTLRRYCHFGTGNYNENTAKLYSDLSLLTCEEHLGADASLFFNSVTGLTRLTSFRRLYPSPAMMKARLLSLIEAETQRAVQGEKAGIRAKMNSLNDREMIDALERASAAGVKIRLNIRGICCWAPSTERGRENTRIVSIVDRYLEHARILSFHNGGNPLVYLASADWMSRNLDRRVELMIPIEDPQLSRRVRDVLDACFKDNTQASLIQADGTSIPVSGKKRPFAMQAHLQRQARRRARTHERAKQLILEPHRPKGKG